MNMSNVVAKDWRHSYKLSLKIKSPLPKRLNSFSKWAASGNIQEFLKEEGTCLARQFRGISLGMNELQMSRQLLFICIHRGEEGKRTGSQKRLRSGRQRKEQGECEPGRHQCPAWTEQWGGWPVWNTESCWGTVKRRWERHVTAWF